jgi:hypothetical protein
MAGFVRFVLIVLLVYLIASLFLRYIFPWVLRLFLKRMSEKTRKQYEQQDPGTGKKKGDVSINYKPKTKKVIDKDTGDYIPFEEVDE